MDSLSNLPSCADAKNKLELFEQVISSMEGAMFGDDACPLEHIFLDNLYGRQVFMEKGLTVVSRVHITENISILLQGDVLIYSEDGTLKRLVAPCVFVTKAGTKRAVHMLEDSIFMTVHSFTATNPEEARNLMAVDTFAEYEAKQLMLTNSLSED